MRRTTLPFFGSAPDPGIPTRRLRSQPPEMKCVLEFHVVLNETINGVNVIMIILDLARSNYTFGV